VLMQGGYDVYVRCCCCFLVIIPISSGAMVVSVGGSRHMRITGRRSLQLVKDGTENEYHGEWVTVPEYNLVREPMFSSLGNLCTLCLWYKITKRPLYLQVLLLYNFSLQVFGISKH
jgi:hypothetical protein